MSTSSGFLLFETYPASRFRRFTFNRLIIVLVSLFFDFIYNPMELSIQESPSQL